MQAANLLGIYNSIINTNKSYESKVTDPDRTSSARDLDCHTARELLLNHSMHYDSS